MVPTALFSSFGEDDYNQEDSGDDSDSEEPSEPAKEEAPVVEEPKKDGKPITESGYQHMPKKRGKGDLEVEQEQLKLLVVFFDNFFVFLF